MKSKFVYVVRNLRNIADCLEEGNFEAGDLEGCVEQLNEISKLIKEAMQYVGEKEVA